MKILAAVCFSLSFFVCVETISAQEKELPPDLWTRKAGEDWQQFLGPGIDSKSSETGILKDWSPDNLKIVWQKPLTESYGIGSVARGRLIQLDRVEDNCVVMCLNAETGKEIWSFKFPTDYIDRYGYNGGPRCSPVIDGDRVYIFGAEGMLYCLKVVDGDVIWKLNTTEEFEVQQNFFGVGSTPVVEDDLLLVMIGGGADDGEGNGNGSGIVAFDKLTGKIRYKITKQLASYASLKTCTIGDRRWCFAFARGGLVGFEPSSGKVDFQFPWRAPILESVNASVPVVFDDKVFISETYGPGSALLKVAPGKSEVVWQDEPRGREKAMQTHWNTAIEHNGYIYGSSGRHSGGAELRCIEAATGKIMWSQPRLARCSLMYVDGHFVCHGEYGQLILLEATHTAFKPVTEIELIRPTGKESVRPQPLLKYPCWAAPILSHGLLYVRGDDRLVCLELIVEE